MARADHVTLAIHDVAGQQVATLLDAELGAGPVAVRWDGRDAQGGNLSSGVYFATLVTDHGRAVQKLTLLK